ncbi:MAG: hypothetical protein ABS935_11320 [Solibacillus sp.]|uniref:hypothetical protein n=1 Tax=Solibacillus sp. TaxID=1909654 RepID=UPI003314A42D
MSDNLEEEIVRMLSPKIKSVLKQTQRQYQEDLEQELLLMIITKVKNKKYFSKAPSFFQLVGETDRPKPK